MIAALRRIHSLGPWIHRPGGHVYRIAKGESWGKYSSNH